MARMEQNSRWQSWRPGLLAALAVTFVAVLPSWQAWRARGGAWAANDVSFSVDEVSYCAYVNALADGRPRLNDPYSGRDNAPHESLFSIQFVPPYLLAGAARLSGLTAPQLFFALNFVLPFAATLALFWLLKAVTGDGAVAATGALCVLLLGTFALLYGPVCKLLGWDKYYNTIAYLPFMRRYVPAVPFPLFWAFGACAWRALTVADFEPPASRLPRLLPAVGAGFLFAALVFSYFYLWTAAAAWLAALAVLFWAARPSSRPSLVAPLAIMVGCALAALLPYALLVARRAPAMDTVQLLAYTHRPDLTRSSVIIGFLVCAALAQAAWRGRIAWREPRVLFTVSCALAPFVMFNQQMVTGRSLQPLHYEMFVAKYLALVAVWLALWLHGQLRPRRLGLVALLAVGWGVAEASISARWQLNAYPQANGVGPAARRLHELTPPGRPATVLYVNLEDADAAPTHAPQAVLWSPHLPAFAGVSEAENKERIRQLMYFTGITLDGVDDANFRQTEWRTRFLLHSLLEWALNDAAWTANWQPLTVDKIRAEIAAYRDYARVFNRERAAQIPLSFLVVNNHNAPVDLSNLDKWYERDAGTVSGDHTIYRVRLRGP
jgi:hypothetical protein